MEKKQYKTMAEAIDASFEQERDQKKSIEKYVQDMQAEKIERNHKRRLHYNEKLRAYLKCKIADIEPIDPTYLENHEEIDRLQGEAREKAQIEYLLHPVISSVDLSEKFRVFRDVLAEDFEVFTDRRELLFFAAIEADALRLIDEARAEGLAEGKSEVRSR